MVGKNLICKGDRRFFAKWNTCFCEGNRLIQDPCFNDIFIGLPKNSPLFLPAPLDVGAIKLFSIPHDLFDDMEPALEQTFFAAFVRHLTTRKDYIETPHGINPTNKQQLIVCLSRKSTP